MKNEVGSKMEELMKDDGYTNQSKKAIHEFTRDMSAPLKKMKQAMLSAVVADCYKEEHMSDTFTNSEQIAICR
mgnify:CR=1 FL=1